MAELLSSHRQPSRVRTLILIALGLVVAAGVVFALFYKHENHAPVEAEIVRVLPLPVHVQYGHVAQTAGPDETEDVIYIVTVVRLHDRSDVPLFVKDIAQTVTLHDGQENPGKLISTRDLDRLKQLVPTIVPVLEQTGSTPLAPEQQVAPGATATGYQVFLYSMPPAEWTNRQSASLRVDFYHQDSLSLPLPK